MAIRNLQTEAQYEDGLGYDDLLSIVGGEAAAPAAAPAWEPLAQQISAQWQQYGIKPDIRGINRANELAQILTNYGITDLSKLGIKETPYEEQVNVGYGGENAVDDWQTVTKKRGQLTYGDQTFGRLGGFGSGGEKEFSDPQEYLQQSDPGRYGLGYSAAGKGWVEYELVPGPEGKPVIVPRWGSSSDIDPGLIQVLSLAAMPFTGGLAGAIAPGLAGQIGAQALISGTLGGLGSAAQGGSFGKGFGRGAVAGGLGAAAGPVLGQLGSEAGKIVGGGPLGDIVSSAVQGAGRGAVGAVVTGDSVLDALLTGAAGGAASAGTDILLKGTNSTLGQYLKDVPAPVKNAVLSAASAGILGKDIDKAVVNSFMRDMLRDVKTPVSGKAASAGYGGADLGYFDPDAETSPLPDWALDPYKDETKPGEYYAGLDKIIDEWDEADIIPDTYDTAPRTTMSPNDMAKFLEANIDDPGTIDTLMQDYFPELYRESIGVTGTLPKKDVIIPDWDVMEEPDRTPGTPTDTTPQPPMPDDDRTVATTPAVTAPAPKPATPGKAPTPSPAPKAAAKGTDLSALFALLGAMGGQQPTQAPSPYQTARIDAESPFGLMYGMRG